jgi:hypothetical protein
MLGHGQAASSFPTPRLPQNTISMSKPCSQQTGHIEIFRLGSRPGALKIGLAAQSLTGKAAAAGQVGLVSGSISTPRTFWPCTLPGLPSFQDCPIHAQCPPLGKKVRDDLRSLRSCCSMCAIYRRALLEEGQPETRSQSGPLPQSESSFVAWARAIKAHTYATNHVNLFLGETRGGPLGLALISASPSLAIRPPWKAPAAFATSHHTAFCRNTHHVHVSRQSIRLGFAGKVSSRRGNNSIAIDHHRMLQVLGFGEYSMSNLVIN